LLLNENDDWFDPNSSFRTSKLPTLEAFLADFAANPSRYICASLPSLPFADRSFDLVLSSHLLFCYAPVGDGGILQGDTYDLQFHINAVTELARVCKKELRITPTHAMTLPTTSHPYLKPIMDHLQTLGFATRLAPALSGWIEQSEVLVAQRE